MILWRHPVARSFHASTPHKWRPSFATKKLSAWRLMPLMPAPLNVHRASHTVLILRADGWQSLDPPLRSPGPDLLLPQHRFSWGYSTCKGRSHTASAAQPGASSLKPPHAAHWPVFCTKTRHVGHTEASFKQWALGGRQD